MEGIDVAGSIYDIPFPDESFDSIVCTQVFEHLAYPWKAVKEIRRVLKKGGCVLITVPQTSPLHGEPWDYYRYTHWGLEALFEDFELIEMKRCGNYYANQAENQICYWCDTWSLHNRPIIGRIAGKLINWYGRFMIWRDSNSVASLQHTIGWVTVFKNR
jgi:ubiquinone/menaquinone biosynthesis C-methylase UbiE